MVLRRLLCALALGCALFAPEKSALAQADTASLIQALGEARNYSELEKAVDALAATGDSAAVPALEALSAGALYTQKLGGPVRIGIERGADLVLTDPLTGESAGTEPAGGYERIRVNNRLRRSLRGAIGALTLLSPKPEIRLAAAQAVYKNRDASALETVEEALAKESEPRVRAALELARAAIQLAGEAGDDVKLAALEIIGERGGRESLALLGQVSANASPAVAEAAQIAVQKIQASLRWWSILQNITYGISLGSVLLLAAIGLAITFGVMGVINMAHGEMVMIGAYTTFMVQEVIRTSFPGLFDVSVLIALPLAFLVAGAVGIVIERGVIRFLYGRPLETLLATWGLSLILQQAVRTIFGPTNREVGNPSWMSGAFDIGQISLTYGRLWIIVFALIVFTALMLMLRRTPLGLQMRAVTQNRRMAASMGIRTPWVDAMTFGLGSGVAGLAGVALSQIDNVSPNLGQGYIIDSFMIVIFGGVGNLWGTLVGAFTLGVVNKFLEPYAGAVLGKIFVLVFIILFIQIKPRGLFALKGRAVEQ
ncbi:MAG: urea ABC transporter permease subunit UrtB [Alphaproteobacteria bacterium]|nr:urea ABC transporter permease subunit UrtB [Alphaproteobacteria bacterium]MBU0798119.1 urea ABC transporter permease subunit UrtB [Alphaproteobacteria bacterium]MBU0887064.1 urea ABC transporter permease subunit UrtB [Alphaproteobacteria bacterium]MBU1814314.1 urea ABC transporter permease subunit UrtB [Alphaproteobacteria bacterium]